MPGYRSAWTVLILAGCVQAGVGLQRGASDFEAERRRMVSQQLEARDIRAARVLDAMRKVPRHLFVPEPQRAKPTSILLCRSATSRPSHNPTSWPS